MNMKKQNLQINKEIFQELRKAITQRDGKSYSSHIKKILKENRIIGISYNYGRN
ncbi:MAG: hypothetical protein KGD57_00270 [Candidatus Lokiarchaeota archaeon]|nr:hypothetical protein [Candidatus Lokiarchaeota archaeon]